MKVSLVAAQGTEKAAGRSILKAKPLVVQTKPFRFWQFALWMVASLGAGAAIFLMGQMHLINFNATGVLQPSRVDIAVLVFAVAALCWFVMRCWKYFDPCPDVRITPGAAPLGSSFDVEWTFRGSKRRLKMIAIALEGREEVLAENKTGKRARSQKLIAPFYVENLPMPPRMGEGQVHAQVPEGLMPTFDSENTRIVWIVRFENQIKWGARMKYEFPVQVLPEVAHG
ncbi:MAG TPA: hypothetical protein VJ063_06100 [Verrucomicrobiae bacterium]|nr:hypothetical protein [Verrucomicrobiae bacterium]